MQLYVQHLVRMRWFFAVAPLLLSTPAPAHAQADCVFDTPSFSAAAPYSQDEYTSYGSWSWLRGAQLYVPAQAGLTREWLATSIYNASAALSCNNNVPQLTGLEVHVTSAEHGFWIQLLARDEHDGHAVLAWARGVAQQH